MCSFGVLCMTCWYIFHLTIIAVQIMVLVVELLYCGQMPKQIELVFMAAHSNGQAIIFLRCGFFYLLLIVFFLFFLT